MYQNLRNPVAKTQVSRKLPVNYFQRVLKVVSRKCQRVQHSFDEVTRLWQLTSEPLVSLSPVSTVVPASIRNSRLFVPPSRTARPSYAAVMLISLSMVMEPELTSCTPAARKSCVPGDAPATAPLSPFPLATNPGGNGGNVGGGIGDGGNDGNGGGSIVTTKDAVPKDPSKSVRLALYAVNTAPFQPSPHESTIVSVQNVPAATSRLPLNGAPPLRTTSLPHVSDQDTSVG